MKQCKCITLFIITFFLLTSFAFSAPDLAAFLRKHARENELYRTGELSINDESPHALIILEDAHCNAPIQKHLIILTKFFNQDLIQTGLVTTPLVLQEGGVFGAIDTTILQKGKAPDELRTYLDGKLASGEVGAAEYLHAQEGGFTFLGIEDASLYEANYRHFMDIAKKRNAIQTIVHDIDEKLTGLQALIFSAKLREFYTTIHHDDEIENIDEHLEQLRVLSLQYSIDINNYTTLAQYFETTQALHNINTPKIDNEIAQFNRVHNSAITIDTIYDLYTAGIITLTEHPELFKFGKLKEGLGTIKMIAFIKEKETLEGELLHKVALTDEEKELVGALRDFSIAKKILSFTLNRDEYAYYAEELSRGRNLLAELTQYIQSYYQSFTVSLPLESLQKSAEEFYHAVNERDNALTQNIIKALADFNTPIATLIIGGFHTDGITQRLKEINISFLVITPKLENVDTSSIDTYYDVMKRFWQGRS